MPRTRLSLKSAGSQQPSPSNTKVLVMAHSSSNRCQSLLERARRDDSREKIAPTCPIATSLTRVLKSSRLVVSSPDWARSPSSRAVAHRAMDGIGRLYGVAANHLSNVRHPTSPWQVKIVAEKRWKRPFHRTILPFATETS